MCVFCWAEKVYLQFLTLKGYTLSFSMGNGDPTFNCGNPYQWVYKTLL